MSSLTQSSPSPVLRALAAALRRLADRVQRPLVRRLALEPLAPSGGAEERIRERRHEIFTRYY